ncbi:MAG: bifunctional aminodeoxychorismate synthase component I/aminotransferase [Desulfotalea sp.]|nr:MAG: bifunctional aminodeoxychorismate synthase component I/aminotransferase [Desulfotalea sp.]
MLRIQDPLLEELLQFCSLQDEFVFLDTSLPDQENSQSLLFVKPRRRLVCREGDDLELYLKLLQKQLSSGYYLAGWIGYEFGCMLEARYDQDTSSFSEPPVILADFGVFVKPFKFNHHTGDNNFPLQYQHGFGAFDSEYSISNLKPNMEQAEFVEALGKVKEYIAAGDTYQVNYTMKLLFEFQGSVSAFYRSLRRNQSVGYGAYIKNRQEHILSFSPELFFRKTADKIITRPMKGTAIRGNNLAEELGNISALRCDPKNRAENVMIVDLLRNDLSRLLCCEEDSSVTTVSLFDVESYESLLQMTSTVHGEAPKDVIKNLSLCRLIQSLFPCGSITGAPKIRTMQIIQELEKGARGVYTGAIGYFAPDGDAVFNVPIRTICLRGGRGEMGIGAGITHGSNPHEEWRESLLKGRFMTHCQPNFNLFETILWREGSGFYLLDEHLLRLKRGATYFKFSIDVRELEKRLEERAASFLEADFCQSGVRSQKNDAAPTTNKLDIVPEQLLCSPPAKSCMRVRLVLEKDGRVSIVAVACEPPRFTQLPVASEIEKRAVSGRIRYAEEGVKEEKQYLNYKTSRRLTYDRQYKKVLCRGDADAIFCNEKGEITEGCISNIVILKDGVFITPQVHCGLLPGVMREQLLAGTAGSSVPVEMILRRDDLEEADALFICNSVRGVVRVRLVT